MSNVSVEGARISEISNKIEGNPSRATEGERPQGHSLPERDASKTCSTSPGQLMSWFHRYAFVIYFARRLLPFFLPSFFYPPSPPPPPLSPSLFFSLFLPRLASPGSFLLSRLPLAESTASRCIYVPRSYTL